MCAILISGKKEKEKEIFQRRSFQIQIFSNSILLFLENGKCSLFLKITKMLTTYCLYATGIVQNDTKLLVGMRRKYHCNTTYMMAIFAKFVKRNF